MTWLKHGERYIGGADGYRIEIYRKDSTLWVREVWTAGNLCCTTWHSSLRDAKVWPQP